MRANVHVHPRGHGQFIVVLKKYRFLQVLQLCEGHHIYKSSWIPTVGESSDPYVVATIRMSPEEFQLLSLSSFKRMAFQFVPKSQAQDATPLIYPREKYPVS